MPISQQEKLSLHHYQLGISLILSKIRKKTNPNLSIFHSHSLSSHNKRLLCFNMNCTVSPWVTMTIAMGAAKDTYLTFHQNQSLYRRHMYKHWTMENYGENTIILQHSRHNRGIFFNIKNKDNRNIFELRKGWNKNQTV